MNNSIIKPDMSVSIAGVTLKNPVLTASGTCGYGREYADYYKPSELGAITVKCVTREPRAGNKPPRIAETPGGMLNSIGLQNPGLEVYLKEELPWLKENGATVIANIAGYTADDYCYVAERISDSATDMLEMNISCPNVKEGGVAFGVNPDTVYEITKKVKAASSLPLIVKLTPNVSDIRQTASAAEAGGADAISLINTLLGMRIDTATRRPVLKNNIGGLSGPAVFPVALRMVWQVCYTVKIPVIGMGGVATGNDAVEMLLAGASAVAVGAASFSDPMAPVNVCRGIEAYLKKNNIPRVPDLIGGVVPY